MMQDKLWVVHEAKELAQMYVVVTMRIGKQWSEHLPPETGVGSWRWAPSCGHSAAGCSEESQTTGPLDARGKENWYHGLELGEY